jgi:hypothetical protein
MTATTVCFPTWLPSEVREAILASPLSTGSLQLLAWILAQDVDSLEVQGGFRALAARVGADETQEPLVRACLEQLGSTRLLIRNFEGVQGLTLELSTIVCWAWCPANGDSPEVLFLGSPLVRFAPPVAPKEEGQS